MCLTMFNIYFKWFCFHYTLFVWNIRQLYIVTVTLSAQERKPDALLYLDLASAPTFASSKRREVATWSGFAAPGGGVRWFLWEKNNVKTMIGIWQELFMDKFCFFC